MSKWHAFLDSVNQHIEKLRGVGCDVPFFRGHSQNEWRLLSGLGRQPPGSLKRQRLEGILYYDFLSSGGSLLGKSADSWDVLFAMQHHGLPTRLLDWSTSFASALYFALKPYLALDDLQELQAIQIPCVWVLDPFELNRASNNEASVLNPYTDLQGSYQENFIEETKKFGANILAINPPQLSPRQAAQRSVFTLHGGLFLPLEDLPVAPLRKFDLPTDSLHDASVFLSLAGVNEFTVFPDLDGLARHLRREHGC